MRPVSEMLRSHPRTYQYSLDWRFLLPMGDDARILVLSEEGDDFAQTLQRVGMTGLGFQEGLSLILHAPGLCEDLGALVLPFGLPDRRTGLPEQEQVDFFRAARRCIRPGGFLLLGFDNPWNLRSKTRTRYQASTPGRVSALLRHAGYTSIEVFGAGPNLKIPEYIFHLEPRVLDYTFRQRFKRKALIRDSLRWLLRRAGPERVSALLPCYFVTATA